MPRPPLEPRLKKRERKALARRRRRLLAGAPRNMRPMADGLEVEPEAVVVALRELRARRRGQLRTTIRLGHVCWSWQPPAEASDAAPEPKPSKRALERSEGPAPAAKPRERSEGKTGKKKRRKHESDEPVQFPASPQGE
jgi:hypothetical protein